MDKHIPVMLNEVINILNIKPDGIYLDLTLGRGGHSQKILKKLVNGKLICFDKDKIAIHESGKNLKNISNNFLLIHSDFKNLKIELDKLKITSVDGILIDLGVSSPQLDNAERGFSYSKEGKLDMRMNQEQNFDAYNLVNNYNQEDLVEIFRTFADVKLPKRVAKAIIENRPIYSTLELVDIIRKSLPAPVVRKKNPAKAVFQAIRIAVNNELDSLKEVLEQGTDLLTEDGRLVVITFHSIEDRIVKKYFGSLIVDNTGKLPIIVKKEYIAKTIRPSVKEVEINRRSRSAKLRALIKVG